MPFQIGDYVIVNQDHYPFTQAGSFGVVTEGGGDYVKVTFLYVNHAGWARVSRARINDLDMLDMRINTGFLRMMTPDEEDQFLNDAIIEFENAYGLNFQDWLNAIPRPVSRRPGYSTGERIYVTPVGGGRLWWNGPVNREQETLPATIKRLHLTQKFYLEHKDELPSWSVS